ncbi:methylenetetrahydrofolate reductase [Rhodoluna limnophila]|uniref:methylenetetrahydrofolate reductase n=1 Tax=Rhodoluna limnophila TaxID=232537 RepID=UPI00110710E7|nr:methylenetetrahydrofolate reductase [Rhodoluna limnophila]
MPEFPLLRKTELDLSSFRKITEVMQARSVIGEPTLSFEFFPPKDDAGEERLWDAFEKLLEVKPDYVSVTYGAGGSSQDRSLSVVQRMAKSVPTIGHLTCVGATTQSTIDIIRQFEAANVAAILALRGDAPKDDPDALGKGQLKTALELIEVANQNSHLEIGVAAFPEVHPESPDMAHDSMVLALKQAAGAKFAVTQLFFSVKAYTDLVSSAAEAGVTIPIVPGVMPIANAKQVIRMAAMSGAAMPAELLEALEGLDDEAASKLGMEFSKQLSVDLIAAGAPGLHIFSLNQHAAAIELARGAGLCR